MTIRTFKYVRHPDIASYVEAGWINTGRLQGTHHGHYSEILEWPGSEEPIYPQSASAAVSAVLHGDWQSIGDVASRVVENLAKKEAAE